MTKHNSKVMNVSASSNVTLGKSSQSEVTQRRTESREQHFITDHLRPQETRRPLTNRTCTWLHSRFSHSTEFSQRTGSLNVYRKCLKSKCLFHFSVNYSVCSSPLTLALNTRLEDFPNMTRVGPNTASDETDDFQLLHFNWDVSHAQISHCLQVSCQFKCRAQAQQLQTAFKLLQFLTLNISCFQCLSNDISTIFKN